MENSVYQTNSFSIFVEYVSVTTLYVLFVEIYTSVVKIWGSPLTQHIILKLDRYRGGHCLTTIVWTNTHKLINIFLPLSGSGLSYTWESDLSTPTFNQPFSEVDIALLFTAIYHIGFSFDTTRQCHDSRPNISYLTPKHFLKPFGREYYQTTYASTQFKNKTWVPSFLNNPQNGYCWKLSFLLYPVNKKDLAL